MEVVTAPKGAPLSSEPVPRLRNYPLTHWVKEVPLPASLPRWAIAAASLITAFSAWTRRYLAFPSLFSPFSWPRAERKPERLLPLSFPSVCARALCCWAGAALRGSSMFTEPSVSQTVLCSALHNSVSLQCQMELLHFPGRVEPCSNILKLKCQEILGVFFMHF